jgi:hypothetical protein
MISAFEEKYKKLSEEIKIAQDKIRAESQELINSIFKDYFAKYGELVYAIHWVQGTPGFNDGDPCYFSVHDMYLSFTEEGYDDGEGDAHEFDRTDLLLRELKNWEEFEANPQAVYEAAKAQYERSYSYSRTPFKSFSVFSPSYISKEEILERLQWIEENREKFADAIRDFEVIEKALRHIDDDYMEMIYGDNMKITYFGPDGRLETDEYDLGY